MFFRVIFLFIGALPMKSTDLMNTIIADGWYLVKVSISHHHFKHDDKEGKVTIPHRKKTFQKAPQKAF